MPLPGSSPETPFADLVSRYLDGTASAAEHEALTLALLADAERGREFASQVRFESMLRRTCRRDAKALFEFAALEAACDDFADTADADVGVDVDVGVTVMPAPAAVVAAGAVRSSPSFQQKLEHRQQPRPARWRSAATSPWLRIAAVFLALASSVALWFNREPGSQPASQSQVASAPATALQVQTATDDQMVLLAPRHTETTGTTKANTAAAGPQAPTLAERLEDFYLPAVHLHQVRAQDAADWLTAQLRQHNYAKRPDLNRLTLRLPPSLASRIVTLESGPISFKKAVEIVTTLAGGEATVGQDAIQVVDSTTPAGDEPAWQASPWDKEQARQQAAALGITLDESMLKEEAGGGTSLRLPADQQRALGTLAQAQQQLGSLAPLSFVPFIVPAGAAGAQRVLSSSTVDSIRQQLATTPGTASLPTVTVPFGSSSQGTSLLNGSGDTAVTVKVTPVGEMNQVTIQPTTTTPPATSTTTTNLLADNSSSTTTPPPRVDAVLDSNQGVVTNIDNTGTQLFTAEGIPIPPGYEWLYGLAASAPPEDPNATTLVLVPVP